MKKLLLILLGSVSLVACEDKVYTVKEFLENPELLEKYRAECRNGSIDPELLVCRNASRAKKEQASAEDMEMLGK